MSGYTSSQVMNLLSELQSTDLPGALHRVQHPGSQGASDHFGNLKARPSSTSLGSVSEFRVALANHLQWGYSTSLSCFLSVFDERKLAEDWARTRYERAQSNRSLTSDTTTLHSISTEHLQHTIVFPVSTLLSCFGMKSNRDITHELLIVDQIPARAITGQTDIGSLVGQGKPINPLSLCYSL